MNENGSDSAERAQPIPLPVIIDNEHGIGYVWINGQWMKMSQRMYDDRQLRSVVLQQQQAENDQLKAENKRLQMELLYRYVIERYNRAHGQNRKITLKQICNQMNVSYDAVRTYRSRERKRKNKK